MSTKGKLKQLATAVGAGIIGSVVTLTAMLNLNLTPTEPNLNTNEQVPQTQSEQPYEVQQTSSTSLTAADIVENTSNAIVGIVNMQQQVNPFANSAETVEAGTGSGVVFNKEGDHAYIVTNNHVIENADSVDVSFENGEKATAEVIGTDALTDLAVLRVDAKYADAVLPFGDSDTLRAGDQVFAIGNPLGLDFSRTVTQGIISAIDRSINVKTSAGNWDLQVIQTDAAINPGNSGGALINSNGELIGINSLKIAERGIEGLGFAIPSNDAEPIVTEIIKYGKVERPFLGISLVDLEQIPRQYLEDLPEEVMEGVVIAQISPNSAAAKAGVEEEDVIVAIGDTEVANSNELRKALYNLKVGETTSLTIYRGKEKKELKLNLESEDML